METGDVVEDDLRRVSGYLGFNPDNFRENRSICARIYGEAKGRLEAEGRFSERALWDRIAEDCRRRIAS